MKIFDIFLIPTQNIDCGYKFEPHQWGGSNEYPHSMFESRKKEIINTPSNPTFYYIRWGLQGYSLHRLVILLDDGHTMLK